MRPPNPSLDALHAALQVEGLMLSGLCHTTEQEPCGAGTVALLSPGPGFWPLFETTPDYQDGQPDPLDRWSRRVVGDLARRLDAQALFPFGGPPYLPFMRWAIRSGEAFSSPIHFLVHRQAGLWLSWRGALFWPTLWVLPEAAYARPCDGCPDQPCLAACPVSAFTAEGYDSAACHGWLDNEPTNGGDCMGKGCAARRACPVSQAFGRREAHAAFHMRAFHPRPE